MKLVVLFALFSLLFHGGIYPKASADTVTVDTTDDVINGDTSSITTLMSTPGADGISLREAIIATNNTSGADQINLAAETYLLSIFGIEDDALQGDFDIRDDLTIVGVSASATRIDGTALSRIFEVHNDTAITVTISNLKLEGATPLAGLVGAAIHIKGDVTVPDVTLSNVWLTNNSTGISADGGAIYNEGMLTVTDSLIDTNTGLNGGAIYNHANGDVTLINVTLSGNTAGLMHHGGGLYNDGIATLQNVTITANEANQGGGIYDTGPGAITSIINTIVAGNSAPTSPDVSGDLSSGGFNIFGDQSGGSGFDPSTLETDPLLGPLQNNGGPTFTHALLDGSPAIDAGTAAGAPLVDQRGVDRDARPDIGAYEEQVISALWLSTEDDVPSPSQVPGLDSWGQDEVLVFDEPDFNLEPGFTDGTLYPVFNLDPFAQDGDADVQGLHYVSQDISVGGNFFPAIDLFTGDLLLIVDANETFDGTGINLLSVTSHDVVVFRPDVAGDYSAGTFLLLLQDPSGDPLKSISLIENLTLVGDVTLGKGTFIFSQLNNDDDAIYHFDTDDVGTNTSGVVSVLLDGSAFGLDQPVAGLDLVEQGLTAGGTALQAGTLLVTLEQDDGSVGIANPISTTQQDIFYLTVAATSMGSGTSAADATLLLEGSDVGLNTDAEDLDALTLLATVVNNPPTALNSTVSAVEDTPYTFTVSDFNFSDLDGENLAQLRIKTVETAGDLELSGADVTAGQVISATDITAGDLKFTPDPNDNASHYATFEFYVHDGIEYSDNSYTMTIAVAEQADAPGVTSTTTEEDTQSSTGLVLSLNAADGEGVTHFKITDISGGTLYQNDGITAIHAGDFITFWEGYAGLKFTPAANSTASGSFSVQASTANHDIGLGVDSVTATITVIPVGDTPQAASIVTLEDTPSGPIVLARNMHDGPEVTHFRITNVAGGQLVHADGMTVVSHGDFITFSQGNSGLQFTPSQNSTAVGSFDVESSEDGLTVASQSGIATATISVIPVADTPSITHANTLEDTQTTSGLVISRHAADGPEVTHFNITNIAGGTLYQNNGTTIISTGDFITVAQGNAGLKFTPSLNVNASGSFDVQASTAGQDSGLGGGTVTATIGVKPVNDGPSAIIALANYAISENTPLTLHGTGLSVGDPDAGASTVRVTLSIGEGSLTVMAGSTGVTVSGSGSTSVAFEGTLTQINKLLAGHLGATLIYHSIAATDTVLTLHIDDLGASGAGGRLTATDTATLTIVTIAAENSRPTAIRVSHTTVDENTDTSSGYRIGTLITTDPDSADTSIYTIVGGADAAKFSIGGAVANELILTDGRLDHETTSSYEVMVRVTDSGGLTHDETFTIAVIDLAIVITAGQSFSVAETDAADALVGTVGTTGDHPTTFAITGGNLNNAFAIDASGTITVANSSALDFETTPSYTLTIEVSDGTSSVSETVTIMVTDVAETSSTGDSGLNPGDSEPSSDSPSAGGGAPIPDPTPDAEVHPPTSTSEDNTLPNPPPAEEVSPEPQVSNPQVSNLQTPRPQGSASRPTQLGTGENGFRPGRISPSGRNRERVNTPTPIPATSAQRADTVVVPNGVPPATDDPSRLILAAELLQEFDKMRTEIRTDASLRQAAIGLTVALTTGFSIGYVLWLIRGGLLLSSLLSSLPAWRFVDPLPVLAHLDARSKEDEADDDSLESVIRKGADMANSPCESTPWRSNT